MATELKNKKKEYEENTKELKRVEKELKAKKEELGAVKQKLQQSFDDFAEELDDYSERLMRKWFDTNTVPKAWLREEQTEEFRHNRHQFYLYYNAFSLVHSWDPKNEHRDCSILFKEDSNLKTLEKALVKDLPFIKVDDRFSWDDGSACDLDEVIVWIYAYFYRNSENNDDAINGTKRVLEKEFKLKDAWNIENEVLEFLYEKYLKSQESEVE